MKPIIQQVAQQVTQQVTQQVAQQVAQQVIDKFAALKSQTVTSNAEGNESVTNCHALKMRAAGANLWYMRTFYREYKATPNLQPLAAEISWTKNTVILDRCTKSKKKTVVEYALKSTTQPIGVATYSLTPHLPDAYREMLPSEKEIRDRLNRWAESVDHALQHTASKNGPGFKDTPICKENHQ